MIRSFLFVPGDDAAKHGKGLAGEADALILDLEDSVHGERKDAGRAETVRTLRERRKADDRIWVRVNPFGTPWTEDDVSAVVRERPAGLVLPKCDHRDDLDRLSVMLRVAEAEAGLEDGSVRVLPIVTETPGGTLAAPSYAAGHARLFGLTWGAEDLGAELGASAKRGADGAYLDVFRHAQVQTLLSAKAAGVEAVDTVYPDFRDVEGFRRDCERSAQQGFTARMAIHPAQVPVINTVFAVSDAQIEHARRVLAVFADSRTGVASLDGKMLDRPHLVAAERLLARTGD